MSRVKPLIRAVSGSALAALTVCALAAEPLVEFREGRGCRMRGSAQSVERMKEIATQGSVTWDGACRNGWIDGPGVLRHEGRVLDNGRMRRYAFFFTGIADSGVRRGQWRRESMNMFEDSSRYWTALAVISYTDGVSRGSPRNVVVRSDAEFGAPFRAMLATVDRELAQRAAPPAAETKTAEVPAAVAAITPAPAPARAAEPVVVPAPAAEPAKAATPTPSAATVPPAPPAPAAVPAPSTAIVPPAAPSPAAAPTPSAAPAPAVAAAPAVSAAPAPAPAAPSAPTVPTASAPAPAVATAPTASPPRAAPAGRSTPPSPSATVRSAPGPTAPAAATLRGDTPPTGPSLAMGRPSSGSGLRLPQGMAAPPRERVALEQTHGCSVDTVNGTAASQGSVSVPRKGVMRVTGWAGDPRSNTLPPRAWIQVSSVATAEAVRIPMVRTVDRPDAAKAMGHAIFARSGFDQNLEVDTFPPGQYLVALIQQVDNEFLICSSVAEVSLR